MSNEKIKELYKELCNNFFESGTEFSKMSHFVSMKGKLYDAEKEFRLMLVGRAVNGWESLIFNSDNDFAFEAKKALSNAFNWIEEENGTLVSNYTQDNIDKKYILNCSPFWETSKTIWEKYHKKVDTVRWVDYIAWSNLYKISPPYKNNPDEKMQKIQHDTCVKLLKEEIEYYKPTHILIVTGWDWLESSKSNNFITIFDEVNHIGTNCCRGNNTNDIYLEGTAIYTYSDGTSAKAIISCRPEFRKKEKFIADICKAFE